MLTIVDHGSISQQERKAAAATVVQQETLLGADYVPIRAAYGDTMRGTKRTNADL